MKATSHLLPTLLVQIRHAHNTHTPVTCQFSHLFTSPLEFDSNHWTPSLLLCLQEIFSFIWGLFSVLTFILYSCFLSFSRSAVQEKDQLFGTAHSLTHLEHWKICTSAPKAKLKQRILHRYTKMWICTIPSSYWNRCIQKHVLLTEEFLYFRLKRWYHKLQNHLHMLSLTYTQWLCKLTFLRNTDWSFPSRQHLSY